MSDSQPPRSSSPKSGLSYFESLTRATTDSYAQAIVRRSSIENPVLKAEYASMEARCLAFEKEARRLEALAAVPLSEASAGRGKFLSDTYPFYKVRTRSLASTIATIAKFRAASSPAAAMRGLRSQLSEIMKSQDYLDPMITTIILFVLIGSLDSSPAPMWLLCNWFLNRVPFARIYAEANWIFALSDDMRKRLWEGHGMETFTELSPHEMGQGEAVALAAFPVPPFEWSDFSSSTAKLLASLCTSLVGGRAPAASTSTIAPPVGTYPLTLLSMPSLFPATGAPSLASMLAPLRGAGYAVHVVDGMVDLTVVETHVGHLKAEVDRLRKELADTKRLVESLKRATNSANQRVDNIAAAARGRGGRGRGGNLQGGAEEEGATF